MLNNSYECHKVSSYESLSKGQQAELDSYIRGLIHGACLNQNKFNVPDLVGNRFTNWHGTPLDYIYLYHKNRPDCQKPTSEAGKDMGRIFKYVMAKDRFRKYKQIGLIQRAFPVNEYEIVLD